MPRKKKTKTERFLETAKRQFQRSCIPVAAGVCISVGISKLGIPAIPLLVLGGAGVAYWKGYRIRIVKPDGQDGVETKPRQTKEDQPSEDHSTEG